MAKYKPYITEIFVLLIICICLIPFAWAVRSYCPEMDIDLESTYDIIDAVDISQDGDLTTGGDATVTGTVQGGTVTDSTTTITGGNYTGVGNITGTDVDISAGTGDYLSTSDVHVETVTLEGGTYDTVLNAGTPTETVTYTLPPDDGYSDEVLRTDAAGGMLWRGVGSPRTGWPLVPGVTLSFSYPTFTVTDGGSAYYYDEGVRYVLGGNKTVNITDTEGLWYIYFDGDTLTASQSTWIIASGDKALVAHLYWNATDNEAIHLGYELHGYDMSAATHASKHFSDGAKWNGGLLVSDAGSEDVNVTAGNMYDEDIAVTITDSAGGGLWQEVLSPAELPIFYRQLASAWRVYDTGDKTTTTDVGYIDAGNDLQYNKLNGTWQPVDAGVGKYVAYFVVATNEQTHPVSIIMGQRVDTTEALAKVNNVPGGLILTGLPFEEMIYLSRVIVKATAGAPYYSIEDVTDLRNTNQTGNVTTPLTSDHGALGGLADDDHTQYLLADGTRDLTGAWTVTQIITATNFYPNDQVYGIEWNGELSVPTKNAVYDKIESIPTGTTIDADQINAANQIYTIGAASDIYVQDSTGNVLLGYIGDGVVFPDNSDHVLSFQSVDNEPSGGGSGVASFYAKGKVGADVFLMLHLNGADTATSTTDDSPSNHTITFFNQAQIDTAQKKFGVSSCVFDGNADRLEASDTLTDFDFGSGEFTVDCWVRFNTNITDTNNITGIISRWNDLSWVCGITKVGATYKMWFSYSEDGLAGTEFASDVLTVAVDTWYHMAYERSGDTFTFYFDGATKGTGDMTGVTLNDSSDPCKLGVLDTVSAGYDLQGWIDEARVCKGVGKYGGSSFTPEIVEYSGKLSPEMYVIDGSGSNTLLSPHNFSLIPKEKIDNYSYPWSYYSKNENIGKQINVDMYGAIKEIEALTGKKFIYEKDVDIVPLEKTKEEKLALWVQEKRRRELKFRAAQKALLEAELKITELDEPDTGIID